MTTTIVLALLCAAALCAAAALGMLAVRRGRRLTSAEDAIVALARAWSEDGSSRGRVCAAARLVAGADVALLAELTRRGDAVVVTATAGGTELQGDEAPVDPERSNLARALLFGEPIQLLGRDRFAPGDRTLLDRAGLHAARLLPVFRSGHAVAVLAVGWRERCVALDDERLDVLDALAGETCRAIERDAHVALLARQARTDELTALPNRRAWDEAVGREMARAQRTRQPLCLALLDLDHFKAYNDLNGHQAGDAHLRRTAAAWRRELRAIDVLARYGGEEFGVLLPSCDVDMAREVIDRVRSATPNGQTASAGVVVYDGRESAESLLARADAALYRAKHAGRSTTVPA